MKIILMDREGGKCFLQFEPECECGCVYSASLFINGEQPPEAYKVKLIKKDIQFLLKKMEEISNGKNTPIIK